MKGLGDVLSQIKAKAKSTEENIVETIYIVMRRFNYNLKEVLDLPLPTFLALVKLLEKEIKEEERAYKKSMRKR